jgi:flap endonuclease-1
MGIRYMNHFLRENCSPRSIYKIHLRSLKGKTVVIDTSIYLYKFISQEALMENFFQFITILLHYGADPIFIFDGKPPAEKKELLIQRLIEKREAESEYNMILSSTVNNSFTAKQKLKMQDLKKQFIRIQAEDIQQVKTLMDAFGVTYINAQQEADELCAYYMKTGKAWACFSDDMDLLVYENSTNVIRHLSLMNHTAVLYNKKAILHDLQMTENDFNHIMILSGTDYDIHSNTSLKETVRWYHEYNKYRSTIPKTSSPDDFYTWLNNNTKYINNYETLLKTTRLFSDLGETIGLDEEPLRKQMDMTKIKSIMWTDGFLFGA